MSTTFAADYRRIVAPRLRQSARYHALLIAIGTETFHEASGDMIALAYRLGAARLHEELRWDLHDTIAGWLLEALEAELAAWDEAHRLAARVGADIDRHEARCSGEAPP
jgi:hypothetical protein